MSAKDIEVEIRGPLTKGESDKLNTFLQKEGIFKQKKERVLIDYSSGMENRTKDIRIRETNGVPEIVLKLGSWGGTESREEISIKTESGKFESLVKVFGELGYEKGVLCVRNSMVYDYKGIEFALVEVPNHSLFFEAEIVSTPEGAEEAEKNIKQICDELNLKIFSKDDFFEYVTIYPPRSLKNP
jgi:predicted adenylyl cyclase CyaB